LTFEIKDPIPALNFTRLLAKRAHTTRIILHHYHHETATPQDIHRWHLGRDSGNWGGVGYHFMVDMDGTVWHGRDINAVGVHTLGNNGDSIGIAFQGRYNDHTQSMPDIQFNAGVWLINHLFETFGTLPILGHREASPSACPGKFFPLGEIRTLNFRGENMIQRRFNTVAELPDWAQAPIQQLIDAGHLTGDGTVTPSGNIAGLDLTMDMVRTLIINKRQIDKLRSIAI